MPPPFKIIIFLKAEGEQIVVESQPVPMWHILVAYLSTGSLLPRLCIGATNAL